MEYGSMILGESVVQVTHIEQQTQEAQAEVGSLENCLLGWISTETIIK